MADYSFNAYNNTDSNLVEKILERGQELRNAMVGSILRNDPFCKDIIHKKESEKPPCSKVQLDCDKNANMTSLEERRLVAFIKGDCMTEEEEKWALNTIRSLSASDLCKTTERSIGSNRYHCGCFTCKIYNSGYLNCDIKRKSACKAIKESCFNQYSDNSMTRDIQEKYNKENCDSLKYVDSLKISVSNFILNETGYRKVMSDDERIAYNLNHTFFLEYNIPDKLIHNIKSKPKQMSTPDNLIRLCSRKLNDVINFKHIEIHNITSLIQYDLNDIDIIFKLSYRSLKNKSSNLLGKAKFTFGSFLVSKNLTCSRALPVFLNDNVPIVVGTLKVSLQLGCGKLYFGQEFIDGINSSTDRNSVVLDSDDSTNNLVSKEPIEDGVITKPIENTVKADRQVNKKDFLIGLKSEESRKFEIQRKQKSKKINVIDVVDNVKGFSQNNSAYFKKVELDGNKEPLPESDILFGFFFISEAQFLIKPANTHCSCQPFCQTGTSTSKIVPNSSNPVYNFSQTVPLIFNENLLNQLRENYTVIDFWRKEVTTNLLIGITKVPLHQFYLAYRNSTLIKYLSKNRLPVIGTDWWEPIYTTTDEELVGQVQVLTAVGTEDQINHLKSERGFSKNLVRLRVERSLKSEEVHIRPVEKLNSSAIATVNQATNTLVIPQQEYIKSPKSSRVVCDQATNTTSGFISDIKIKPSKSDIAVQSNLTMEQKNIDSEKPNQSQDMLQSFLNQLLVQRQNIHVENSTNTEAVQNLDDADKKLLQAQSKTNVELKKTTDLLDTLQTALSLDSKPKTLSNPHKSTFMANVTILSANHLPSRKKSKSRKSRNKSIKSENILPSCYVTFETLSETDLKITHVVTKSTSPTWNYKCDVDLPTDLLTNNQKRLIFKVWRKSVNTVTKPNMQTDIVLGFVALDVTVLLAGFPNIQGWFNIIDFSGQCNGQINIHVTPLENLSKYQNQTATLTQNCQPASTSVNHPIEVVDPPEPSDLLSRALKRKFVELDEITQRLRLRLSKVTNDDSDTSSDGATEQFEADINALCIEEDFDLVKFKEPLALDMTEEEKEVESETPSDLLITRNKNEEQNEDEMLFEESKASGSNSNFETISSTTSKISLDIDPGRDKEMTLDQHFLEGKQKINTLLEKLSLLSAEACSPFTSRYVSGCSIDDTNSDANINTEAILTELDRSSRPNIQSSLGFDPLRFQQLYGDSVFTDCVKSDSSNLPNKNLKQ